MGKCKSLGACLKTPIGALPPDCSPRRKATLKTRSGRGGVGFLLGLLLWGGCGERATNPETSRQPVVFADSALEEAIVRRLEGQSPLPSALAAIEQLDASGLGISNLSGIEALTGVRDLDLSDNRLEDIAPLAGLNELVFLDLSGNRIADIGALGGLALLRDLRLADNRIVEISPLAGLAGLAFIDLARNELVDLQSLAGLDSLQTLTLSANRVRELTPLLELGRLTHLDLEDNPLSDDVRSDQLQALRQKGVQVLWRPPHRPSAYRPATKPGPNNAPAHP